MSMVSIYLQGTYTDTGILRLNDGNITEWRHLSNKKPPQIPFGSKIDITIIFDDQDFLNGKNGNVWATYDRTQAETIQNALLVQNISSEARELELDEWLLHVLSVPNAKHVQKAIDFIWQDATGMRLKPDWCYPADATNESFRKWINGG